MYPTAEVRWFFQGAIPPDVETWFQRACGDVEREPPRTDHYLRLPDIKNLNVKMREGRIEVKHRVGSTHVARLHERVTGVVEEWQKWSFELAKPGQARWRALSPASSWIAVRKERRLVPFWITRDEKIVARSTSEPPARMRGCELELTRVQTFEQVWWTLAFEAFGDAHALGDSLLLVARHIFDRDEPPTLPTSDSRGYPAWLANLTEPETT